MSYKHGLKMVREIMGPGGNLFLLMLKFLLSCYIVKLPSNYLCFYLDISYNQHGPEMLISWVVVSTERLTTFQDVRISSIYPLSHQRTSQKACKASPVQRTLPIFLFLRSRDVSFFLILKNSFGEF